LTYLELEYPDLAAARAATHTLDELEITGEWYLRKGRTEGSWRLSIASEVVLRPDHLARLGGTPLDEGAAAAAEDTAAVVNGDEGDDEAGDDATDDGE
jgi:hypothetical protein